MVHDAGCDGIRAPISSRCRCPASDSAARRRSHGPLRTGSCGSLPCQCRPHWNDGLLGRRASRRNDGVTGNAWQRQGDRPGRARKQPAGLHHPCYPWLEATQTTNGHSPYCDLVIQEAHVPCHPQNYIRLTPRLYVTSNAPPTFLYLTTDDDQVTPAGSLRFYEALSKRRVDVEMHIFAHGRHASVLGGTDPSLSLWPHLLQEWMRRRGLLPTP